MTIQSKPTSSLLPYDFSSFKKEYFGHHLLEWYKTNKKPLPWRILWDKYFDPYHIWVSEVMLQQTTIQCATVVYERFLKKFPTIKELAAASEEEVLEQVRGLGYYRRFRFLHKAAQLLWDSHFPPNFKWPSTFDEWKILPGIGTYTAAAIASIAFNQPTAVLDGNVARVLCRLLNIQLPVNNTKLLKMLLTFANQLITVKNPGDFNQGMMKLGQNICLSSNPKCEECPVISHCLSKKQGTTHLAPLPAIKDTVEQVEMKLYIIRKKNSSMFGLVPRPKDARFLKESLGFYTQVHSKNNDWFSYEKNFSFHTEAEKKDRKLIGKIRHSITKYRITAEVYESIADKKEEKSFIWHDSSCLEKKLISNLDRKAWHLLTSKGPSDRKDLQLG